MTFYFLLSKCLRAISRSRGVFIVKHSSSVTTILIFNPCSSNLSGSSFSIRSKSVGVNLLIVLIISLE